MSEKGPVVDLRRGGWLNFASSLLLSPLPLPLILLAAVAVSFEKRGVLPEWIIFLFISTTSALTSADAVGVSASAAADDGGSERARLFSISVGDCVEEEELTNVPHFGIAAERVGGAAEASTAASLKSGDAAPMGTARPN